jgi:hypothetical protein
VTTQPELFATEELEEPVGLLDLQAEDGPLGADFDDSDDPDVQVDAPPAPAPAPSPAPPPPTSGADSQLAAARAQLLTYQMQQQDAQLRQAAAQYAQQLEDSGMSSADARQLAGQALQMRQQTIAAQQQAQAAAQLSEGKLAAATHYADIYKVSAKDLIKYNSPQEMEAAAKSQQELNRLRAEVNALKRTGAPAQTFASGSGNTGASMSRSRILDLYNEGRLSSEDPRVQKALNLIS